MKTWLRKSLERLAARVVPANEVSDLLATALPGQVFSPDQRGRHHSVPTRIQQASWYKTAKTLLYLLLYYGGLFHVVRTARRMAGVSRACVLTYHRVNDLGDDPLTTPLRRFAAHMLVLRKYYAVVPSAVLIEKVETGQPFPHGAVVIHFDDCYRDVFTHARPILAALGVTASLFVSSGYVGTARRFPHDARSPRMFENLRPDDLRALAADGFEVGSHTVNHVDLGQCTDETAAAEVTQSKRDLELIVDEPVTLFSFPFGRETNVRPIVEELVRQAGYRAMFSAYGGYVTRRSNLFDLPRVSISGDWGPLDLLMEIEGLSVGALRRWWRRVRRPRAASPRDRLAVSLPAPARDDARLVRGRR